MPARTELVTHVNSLPNDVPTSVGGKPVANWSERVRVARDFIENYDTYIGDIASAIYNQETKFDGTSTVQPLGDVGIVIESRDQIDGGTLASQFNEKGQHPIMLIAANADHIGGSLYRTPRTGDAQEEQAGNTYAGALALASRPGVFGKI